MSEERCEAVTESATGKRTFLEELSRELGGVLGRLWRYAYEERRRREPAARERISVAQLQAGLAARYARTGRLGMDLAHPGWSLMLELFRASLELRPVRLARLAADARVPATTAMCWIEQFVTAGLVRRESVSGREGVIVLSLSDAGAEAMEDYFVAVQLGWAEANAPLWRV